MNPTPRRIAIEGLLTLAVIILQTTVGQFLAIGGVQPDIALVWVVLISLRYGQVAGTAAGFLTGVLIDILGGTDSMVGLSALAKTMAGFLAGYFSNENKTVQTLGSYRFLLILALSSTVHQILYFTIFLQGSGIGVWHAIFFYGLPAACYAVAAGVVPMFIASRRISSQL
jgi:rod shape-determining protein MreD